jgi:uncharacterized membrane protein YccC
MVAAAPTSKHSYEAFLRQGQIKHALKTGLGCCLAIALSYIFHLPSNKLAPVFAYLLMTTGMPSPRLNWLLGHLSTGISAIVSALLLMAFGGAPFLYLTLTLLWIFVCLLFSNWFPLAATLAAMISAIGFFVNFHGTMGKTLAFFASFELNFLVAGFSVAVVHTLIWPLNTPQVFLRRLAQVYTHLEAYCHQTAQQIRSSEPAPVDTSSLEWAPFQGLRQLLAPELRRARDTSNPFARIILACRSLNLHLWFFNRAIAPVAPETLMGKVRQPLADFLERCAEHLHALLEGAMQRNEVAPVDPDLLKEVGAARWDADRTPGEKDILFDLGIHQSNLNRVVKNLQTITVCHNTLVASLGRGLAGELATVRPITTGKRLIDKTSVHAGAKLALMVLLLLVEEALFSLPGGAQVAFFATFFASTGNLGRQNKTDLVGLAGLLMGLAYGVVAAFFTSSLPQFPLLLALVFFGEFLAGLAFQALPRYRFAGMQAGLALPFAYLATTGPGWGSFSTVWTRVAGLIVAGFTAIIIHAYLWPVLPMRQLRASIAAALRDTAESLGHLFRGPRETWQGAPQSLNETVSRARDLLDDALYLPGPDHADPAYHEILRNLQEIDASLEYVYFLIGQEGEHALGARFFQVGRDYAEQAQRNLEQVATQFQEDARQAVRVQTVRWDPDISGRWERACREIGPVADPTVDKVRLMARLVVIARCLDQIASATEGISAMVQEINARNARF